MNARLFLAAGAALALGGCATMSAQECLSADWRQIGYEDGSQGRAAAFLQQRRSDCLDKANIAPDGRAYEQGRLDGLKLYCTPENGFRIGASGGNEPHVCDGPDAGAFFAAFSDGARKYRLTSIVDDLDSRVAGARHEIDDLGDDIADLQARLSANGTTSDERAALAARLKEKSQRRGRLQATLRTMVDERAHAQADLDRFLASMGY